MTNKSIFYFEIKNRPLIKEKNTLSLKNLDISIYEEI